jgi:hypothetical protein
MPKNTLNYRTIDRHAKLRATMLRPSLSAARPGHSISGSDRGSSARRFQGFLTGNMSDQVITVRCGIFFGHYGEVWGSSFSAGRWHGWIVQQDIESRQAESGKQRKARGRSGLLDT